MVVILAGLSGAVLEARATARAKHGTFRPQGQAGFRKDLCTIDQTYIFCMLVQ